MGCSSCGKRRKAIQIRRETSIKPHRLVKQTSKLRAIPTANKKLCPVCRSVMRSLHKYDKSVKKVVRTWYCTKPSCSNSRGSI